MPRGGPIGPPPGGAGVVGGPLSVAQAVPAPLTAVVAVPDAAQRPQDPSAALSVYHGAILLDVQPVALPPNNHLVTY